MTTLSVSDKQDGMKDRTMQTRIDIDRYRRLRQRSRFSPRMHVAQSHSFADSSASPATSAAKARMRPRANELQVLSPSKPEPTATSQQRRPPVPESDFAERKAGRGALARHSNIAATAVCKVHSNDQKHGRDAHVCNIREKTNPTLTPSKTTDVSTTRSTRANTKVHANVEANVAASANLNRRQRAQPRGQGPSAVSTPSSTKKRVLSSILGGVRSSTFLPIKTASPQPRKYPSLLAASRKTLVNPTVPRSRKSLDEALSTQRSSGDDGNTRGRANDSTLPTRDLASQSNSTIFSAYPLALAKSIQSTQSIQSIQSAQSVQSTKPASSFGTAATAASTSASTLASTSRSGPGSRSESEAGSPSACTSAITSRTLPSQPSMLSSSQPSTPSLRSLSGMSAAPSKAKSEMEGSAACPIVLDDQENMDNPCMPQKIVTQHHHHHHHLLHQRHQYHQQRKLGKIAHATQPFSTASNKRQMDKAMPLFKRRDVHIPALAGVGTASTQCSTTVASETIKVDRIMESRNSYEPSASISPISSALPHDDSGSSQQQPYQPQDHQTPIVVDDLQGPSKSMSEPDASDAMGSTYECDDKLLAARNGMRQMSIQSSSGSQHKSHASSTLVAVPENRSSKTSMLIPRHQPNCGREQANCEQLPPQRTFGEINQRTSTSTSTSTGKEDVVIIHCESLNREDGGLVRNDQKRSTKWSQRSALHSTVLQPSRDDASSRNIGTATSSSSLSSSSPAAAAAAVAAAERNNTGGKTNAPRTMIDQRTVRMLYSADFEAMVHSRIADDIANCSNTVNIPNQNHSTHSTGSNYEFHAHLVAPQDEPNAMDYDIVYEAKPDGPLLVYDTHIEDDLRTKSVEFMPLAVDAMIDEASAVANHSDAKSSPTPHDGFWSSALHHHLHRSNNSNGNSKSSSASSNHGNGDGAKSNEWDEHERCIIVYGEHTMDSRMEIHGRVLNQTIVAMASQASQNSHNSALRRIILQCVEVSGDSNDVDMLRSTGVGASADVDADLNGVPFGSKSISHNEDWNSVHSEWVENVYDYEHLLRYTSERANGNASNALLSRVIVQAVDGSTISFIMMEHFDSGKNSTVGSSVLGMNEYAVLMASTSTTTATTLTPPDGTSATTRPVEGLSAKQSFTKKILQRCFKDNTSRIRFVARISRKAASTDKTLQTSRIMQRWINIRKLQLERDSIQKHKRPSPAACLQRTTVTPRQPSTYRTVEAELALPRQWSNAELVAWMVSKRLHSDRTPGDMNGRLIMRLGKNELRDTFYGAHDDELASRLFRALRAENDRIARLRVKRRLARERYEIS